MELSELKQQVTYLEGEVERLHDIERAFQALFQKSPIGIAYHRVVCDEAGTPVDYYFLDANDNYRELTGVDPRGKLVTEAFPGIENDPFDWIGTFGKVALAGETIRFEQYLEPVDRWYDAVGYQTSPGHFVAAFLEITETKRREAELAEYRTRLEDLVAERTAELERAKTQAEAANRAKTVFLANMSHELRTPLNAVLGYSEILSSRETDQRNSRYLRAIRASGTALLTLINDVLDLSRIESGKLDIQHEPVSVRELMDEIDAMFEGKALAKDLTFRVAVDAEVPDAIESDPVRLRQVLVNLVANAIKFTDSGSVTVSCTCAAGSSREADADCVSLDFSIADTGRGIDPVDRERIYESFVQASDRSPSDYEGAGLGLAITKRIVDEMNGSLSLESEVGVGSVFVVRLDRLRILEPAPARERTRDIRFRNGTVLVVDDVEYNRDLLIAYLAPLGLTCYTASTGPDAVAVARREQPDLILMDLKLPGMNGVEVTQRLRRDESTAGIPVVVVTASALLEDEKAIRAVADGYLRKPVVRATLVPEVARHLAHLTVRTDDDAPGTLSAGETEAETASRGPGTTELIALHELALDGNLDAFAERLSLLEEQDPSLARFASELRSLATHYRDEEIIAYLEHRLDESRNG